MTRAEIQNNNAIANKFEPISLEHKELFENIAYRVGIYSDFNFNSFFSWNIDGNHAVTEINGNLATKFSDYVTGEPFYSLIGINDVDETIDELITLSVSEGIKPVLQMVPEATVLALNNPEKYNIIEDRDNFDYVQSIEAISNYSGNAFKNKRQAARRCEKNNNIEIIEHSAGTGLKKEIQNFIEKWKSAKTDKGKDVDVESEYIAISRILAFSDDQDKVLIHTANINNEVVGFSIDELLPDNFVLSHYFKADPSVTGLSEYLNMKVAQKLQLHGCSQWNWEQDLAMENLRTMKMGYRPIRMQKKFSIKRL